MNKIEAMLRLVAQTSTPIDDAEKDDLLHHMSAMYKVGCHITHMPVTALGTAVSWLTIGRRLPVVVRWLKAAGYHVTCYDEGEPCFPGHFTGQIPSCGSDRVRATRPDPTRPVRFRTPSDPIRLDPQVLETLLTRPEGRIMTRQKPCFFHVKVVGLKIAVRYPKI